MSYVNKDCKERLCCNVLSRDFCALCLCSAEEEEDVRV